jgi:hypothetical protein
VYQASPFGGSFFSGGLVPFPVVGSPAAFVPGFFSSTTRPAPVANLAAARPALQQVRQVVATIRDLRARRGMVEQSGARPAPVTRPAPATRPAPVVRTGNTIARLRSNRLIAEGDRHLREANGDLAQVRRAVDAYRRAAAIVGDQPDTFVREAIALVALGERGQADAALAKAVAIDGRLADAPPVRGDRGVDPVFGDRPAGSQQPLAERGAAVVRQIGQDAGAADPSISWLADRWAARFGAADAAGDATPRRIALNR